VRLLPLFALVLALPACHGCGLAADPGVKVVVSAMPSTLDWSTSDPSSGVNYPVLLATQKGLTSVTSDNSVAPGLAKSWERSLTPEGHERYLFHLRTDVRWSDGKTPLTANDFVIGWRRALQGKERGELGELLGADAVLALQAKGVTGPALLPALESVGVRAVDPHTLEVLLTRPRTYFLARLANVYLFFPDPSSDLAGLTADQARTYFDRPRDGKPMSLGPFRVEQWDRAGQRVRLVANPASAFQPPLAKGETVPKVVTLLKSEVGPPLYDRGRVDFVFVDSAVALGQEKPPDLTRQPLLSTYFLALDTERPPLNRLEVRQAISQAIDRKALLHGLLPASRPDKALLPPNLPLSANAEDRAQLLSFHPEKAKALLQAAGGVSRPLRLVYRAGDSFVPEVAIAERIQAQLAAVGVAVTLEPRSDFNAEIARRDPHGKHVFDLYLRRLGADYAHPHTFFTLFQRNGNHQTGWEELDGGRAISRFETLLDEGDGAADPALAQARYAAAERLLLKDEAVVVPLYHPDRYYRMRAGLHGLGVDAFNFLSLAQLRVDEAPR